MSSADRVDTKEVDGKTIITYTADEYQENTDITANYVAPDGTEGTLSFVMVEPGVYQAELDDDVAGIYEMSVIREDGDKLINSINTAAVAILFRPQSLSSKLVKSITCRRLYLPNSDSLNFSSF